MTEQTIETTIREGLDGQPVFVKTESAGGMSNKELLLEVRTDVKALNTKVDILAAQDLHRRLSKVEDWQLKADGRMDTIMKGVPFLSSVIALLMTLATAGGFLLITGGLGG